MADAGYNPIIGVGFAYSDAVNAVAPDYPDTSFGVIDGFDPDEEANDNVAYLGLRRERGLLPRRRGRGPEDPGRPRRLRRRRPQRPDQEVRGRLRRRCPRPSTRSIKVDVKYIEESDLAGFGDPAGGKEAAIAMFDAGADIVYHASGASGSGVFEAAAEAGDGMWAIGVDSDQYLTAPADQQAHILTSMLKRVDVAIFDMIKSVDDGEPLVSYQTYDLTADGVGYSTSGGFIDDITADIDGYADKIKSGEIEVPDRAVIAARRESAHSTGSGPVRRGSVRIGPELSSRGGGEQE